MELKGIKPDVVQYTTFLSGFHKVGKERLAHEVKFNYLEVLACSSHQSFYPPRDYLSVRLVSYKAGQQRKAI
jgi:hypothetical protein